MLYPLSISFCFHDLKRLKRENKATGVLTLKTCSAFVAFLLHLILSISNIEVVGDYDNVNDIKQAVFLYQFNYI